MAGDDPTVDPEKTGIDQSLLLCTELTMAGDDPTVDPEKTGIEPAPAPAPTPTTVLSMSISGIEPLPHPSGGGTEPGSLPGAFRSDGTRGPASVPAGLARLRNNDAPPEHQVHASGDLVVANPVTDYPTDLPQAEGVDPGRLRERTNPSLSDKRCKVALGVALLLFVLLVVIASSLTAYFVQRENGNSDVVSEPPAVVASGAPHTQAPSSLQGHVLSLLPDKTLHSLDEEGSPQARAFDWLMEDMEHNPGYYEGQIQQRFAMASLYFATGGETWNSNAHWLSHDVHECSWFQQTDFASKTFGELIYPGYLAEFFPSEGPTPRCNANGLIVNLWLDANNLVGSLPVELYMLTALKAMAFGFNPGLYGSIASEIGRLTSLEAIINMNLMEKGGGVVPSEIGLLTGLRGLGLYNSGHTGQIPTEIWQLRNLSTLVLGSTNQQPAGSIPSDVGLISNLRWWHILAAGLTGSIPSEIGKLPKLEWCVLEQNQLTGHLPSELGKLTGLRILSLWKNSLSGTLPSQLGEMTSTTVFTAVMNQITGTIPSQIGRLTNMADILSLGSNLLQGEIPTEIGLLTNLEEFNVNGNNHTGPVPSQLGLLTSLEWLGLANNSLTGSVPNELSPLGGSLYLLELHNNALLSGTIPSNLCGINNTCIQNPIKFCEPRQGLTFDCAVLSGCDCTETVPANTTRA